MFERSIVNNKLILRRKTTHDLNEKQKNMLDYESPSGGKKKLDTSLPVVKLKRLVITTQTVDNHITVQPKQCMKDADKEDSFNINGINMCSTLINSPDANTIDTNACKDFNGVKDTHHKLFDDSMNDISGVIENNCPNPDTHTLDTNENNPITTDATSLNNLGQSITEKNNLDVNVAYSMNNSEIVDYNEKNDLNDLNLGRLQSENNSGHVSYETNNETNIDSGADNDDDPDYEESDKDTNSRSSMTSSITHVLETSPDGTKTSINNTDDNDDISVCDDVDLIVPPSQCKGKNKKNYCFYCKTFQAKISRHLENVHKHEDDVKKFALLPKGNPERRKIIDTIRKRGNFLHNTSKHHNTGKIIVCRRPQANKCRVTTDFTVCPHCKGFTKNNIRHHFQTCTGLKGY